MLSLIRIIPVFLHILAINLISSLHLSGKLSKEERLDALNGTLIDINLKDLNTGYQLLIKDRKISCHRKNAPADVVLSGHVTDFIDMFLKKQDADSLFFSRKLNIEGNVEKSVLLKNILANL